MDFYVILGVQRSASDDDIKRAYRRLARKYHPDINPGDRAAEAFFRQIVEAYETLSDPARRRHYDEGGQRAPVADEGAFAFQGFDFSVVGDEMPPSTFGELFAEVFRASSVGEEGGPEHGVDLHATIAVSFEEAMRGAERQVTVTRLESCGRCGGGGVLRGAAVRCGHCGGTGTIRTVRGHMVFAKPCAYCGGTGEQRVRSCPTCLGDGATVRTEAVPVRIPPGVNSGASLRIAGKGHAGRRGGEPGTLYVAVQVDPHPLFERQGDDLLLVVPVAIHEAGLGAKFLVPTIDGPARLRLPPGTQSGQRFRLRGRGAPSMRDGVRGDLVVEVRIVMPPITDERSKELLREFARLNDADVRPHLNQAL
jgi:molecular chaperone DnaJ